MITEKIEVSDEVFASSGIADVRSGRYAGHLVTVKTMRVAAQDDLLKIRKVSIDEIFVPTRRAVSTVQFQRFYR